MLNKVMETIITLSTEIMVFNLKWQTNILVFTLCCFYLRAMSVVRKKKYQIIPF